MQFDWDPAKAKANLAKHGISFEQATKVFDDPFALELDDDYFSEERYRLIGYSGQHLLLLVVYTEREGVSGKPITRLISARRATREERKRYEKG
ncbi:BrnT family toxin [Hyphomicrobium sp. 2TAF46]|uniref:BrnT family toxin n=1 Tax=Hyphomicrobium sp. 2TAF46 TaxID=3233019 RepID=UPI003F92D63E